LIDSTPARRLVATEMDPIPKPLNPFAAESPLALGRVPELLERVFFLPGDWAIWALATYARFLGVGASDYGSVLSGVISALCWLALAIALIMVYAAVRDFDRALTRRVSALYGEVRRRLRMAWVLAMSRRHRARARAEAPSADIAQEIVLGNDELSVLRLHAELKPGYAFAVSDIAAALQTRSYEVQGALDNLKRLNLLSATLGGLDGETAYTLTSAGRAYLIFRQLTPKGPDEQPSSKAGRAAR
jgi:hypothetical protein